MDTQNSMPAPPLYQPNSYQPVMMVPMNGMMMNPSINIYEQQREFRLKMMQQRNEFITKQLKENFPVKYIVFQSIILLLFAITMIGLQITLFVVGSPYAANSSGIW